MLRIYHINCVPFKPLVWHRVAHILSGKYPLGYNIYIMWKNKHISYGNIMQYIYNIYICVCWWYSIISPLRLVKSCQLKLTPWGQWRGRKAIAAWQVAWVPWLGRLINQVNCWRKMEKEDSTIDVLFILVDWLRVPGFPLWKPTIQ
jgi:hypothetical protein